MEGSKVNRIILDPKPRLPQLPVYTEIDHKEIRDAAAAWDAAKVSLDESKKSLIQLEQELPQAQHEDAAADEQLRAEGGKPKLKGRPATQRHEKAIADAAHEQRVCQLAEERTFDALQAALDEHHAEWAETVERDVAALDDDWSAAVNALVELHATRSRALVIRAMLVGDQRGAAALGFKPSQIRGIDFQSGTARQIGYVGAVDVLAALADLGMPPVVVEAAPVEHAPPGRPDGSPNRGQGSVEAEIAERREFAQAATPKLVEERRQRAEQLRQAGEQALADTLNG
jgi:hypothetical protein